jgi:hypothetical protein
VVPAYTQCPWVLDILNVRTDLSLKLVSCDNKESHLGAFSVDLEVDLILTKTSDIEKINNAICHKGVCKLQLLCL